MSGEGEGAPVEAVDAVEALGFDSAKLTAEQRERADALIGRINQHLRPKSDGGDGGMERRGADLKLYETDRNVIAEVNQRLRRRRWAPTWKGLPGVGWELFLAPSDAAYAEAGDTGVRPEPSRIVS